MYDVVLLIEREMTQLDTAQVTGLHEDIEDTVEYHVLLPVEEAAVRLESSMGSLLGSELTHPVVPLSGEELSRIEHEVDDTAKRALEASLRLLQATRHEATGLVTHADPIRALASAVAEFQASEAIVLTEPHVVQEFFHLDWTSRARRHLNVPVLHLLEHETFEEQAGGAGEGSQPL